MAVKWYRYYYRVIGFALAGAGAGLIFDELVNAEALHWTPANHEFWGVVMVVGGLYLVSKKLHGKE